MEKKPARTHKDLEIWKLGIDLVEVVYSVTGTFPKDEIYGLAAQMRRAAVSIPSNISEGAARNSKKEFIQFLYISLASLGELETQFVIAERLKYIDATTASELVDKLRPKILNFIKYLKSR
jgi:four helix bundle protein